MKTLRLANEIYTIVKLGPDSDIPGYVFQSRFYNITKTDDELSIVAEERLVKYLLGTSRGWRRLVVEGQMDFGEVGVISGLSSPLAERGISLFVISTFDTDYLLIKDEHLKAAIGALQHAGFQVLR